MSVLLPADDARRNHHLFKCARGTAAAHRVRHHHYRYGTREKGNNEEHSLLG